MNVNFAKFKGSLPYASELYGVYQPLLGWKSRLMTRRVEAGILSLNRRFIVELFPRFRPQFRISDFAADRAFFELDVAKEGTASSPLLNDATRSFVAQRTMAKIAQAGLEDPEVWRQFTTANELAVTLQEVNEDVQREFANKIQALLEQEAGQIENTQILSPILARESIAAGALNFLGEQGDPAQMMAMLMPTASALRAQDHYQAWQRFVDLIDPRKVALDNAVISPIGVVHLFRQYFFEFDTFLGSPVEHLWLSPGGTVELVEVSTRRILTERITESLTETLARSESSTSTQEEIADAVREENASSTKFGVSVNTASTFSVGIFTAQITTGTSFEMNNSAKIAREQMHKGLRQQTEKLGTELRRSFKSVFRTVTETTDTRSRRYMLANTTDKLVNYELRRKMRQVGVQVQDYGTHLCWQTYVDKPGDQLGIAKLVNIAVPNDMAAQPHPDEIKPPQRYKDEAIAFPFTYPHEVDSEDADLNKTPELYRELTIREIVVTPRPGYRLDTVEVVAMPRPPFTEQWGFAQRQENLVSILPFPRDPALTDEFTHTKIRIFMAPGLNDGQGRLRLPATDEHPTFDFIVTPHFVPSNWLRNSIAEANKANISAANEEKARQYKEKLFNAVKERIKLASHIRPRKYEDLREEERIVVYRNLIRQLMKDTGVETAPVTVQHVFAELVQSMFDVEKMLYFVAPEWWLPRSLNESRPVNQLFRPEIDPNEFKSYSTVSWGRGLDRPDDYFITEDSAPAKLGSSLGWTIQLDGDNLRNAFLNAPWVKAVIPIREGKESKALEWLSAPQVEDNRDLDAIYQPSTPAEEERIRSTLGLSNEQPVTIKDALQYLITDIQAKQTQAKIIAQDENNPELNYLPTDKVYERGFDPLQGGFKAQDLDPDGKQIPFQIFAQWVEVLPTDQIVPVEVEYDPITGMQRA